MPHDAIPLSALGERQALGLSGLLPARPGKVFVSAFLRAQQTAKPYCERVSVSSEIHPLLHEFSAIDPVLLEGMNGEQRRPIADAYWKEANPTHRMGKNAESFGEFAGRVENFIQQLSSFPDGAVLFGHGIWMGLLLWKLLGFYACDSVGMKAFRRFQLGLPMPNCAVYRIIAVAPGHWKVVADQGLIRADLDPPTEPIFLDGDDVYPDELPVWVTFAADTTREQAKNYWRAVASQMIAKGDWNGLRQHFTPEFVAELDAEFLREKPIYKPAA